MEAYLKAMERAAQVPFDQDRFDELWQAMLEDDDGEIAVGELKKEN